MWHWTTLQWHHRRATVATEYQLMIFSHGFNGFRMQSASLVEHLVSWGFVLASADHNDSRDVSSFRAHTTDVSFLMDTMLSPPLHRRIPSLGQHRWWCGSDCYSVGGWSSLMLTVEGQSLYDPRVKAIFAITLTVCFKEWDCNAISNVTVATLMIVVANDTSTYAICGCLQ